MPLFDPERALLVRDPPQLTGSAKRGGTDPPERLVAILAEMAPTTVLCMAAHAKVPDRNAVLAAVRARADRSSTTPRSRVATSVPGSTARSVNAASGSAPAPSTTSSGWQALTREASRRSSRSCVAYAAGRPLSIAELRTAVAGDVAAGLYDTLGDCSGPIPRKARSRSTGCSPKAVRGSTCSPSLRARSATSSSPRPTPATRSGAGLAAALGKPDWQADRLSRQAKACLSATGGRMARGAAQRRSKAQVGRDRRDRWAPARGPAGRCGTDCRARPASPLSRARRRKTLFGLGGLDCGLGGARPSVRRPSVPRFAAVALAAGALAAGLAADFAAAARAGCLALRPLAPPAAAERTAAALGTFCDVASRAAIDARRDFRRRTLFRCSTPFSAARSSARMAACNSASLPCRPLRAARGAP